jgi:hypothetical protein
MKLTTFWNLSISNPTPYLSLFILSPRLSKSDWIENQTYLRSGWRLKSNYNRTGEGIGKRKQNWENWSKSSVQTVPFVGFGFIFLTGFGFIFYFIFCVYGTGMKSLFIKEYQKNTNSQIMKLRRKRKLRR